VEELEKALISKHRLSRTSEMQGRADLQAVYPATNLSYMGNVTNSLSRKFYEKHGVTHIEDGLEKSMPEGEIVAMTTKHCIRYANGMCSKETGKPATPLYISNDHGRFRLDFDCKNCCMKVVSIQN
jgi:putative protease